MTRLRAFAVFCYDFVVGDDWRIAVGVVIGLLVTALLADVSEAAWCVLPVCVALSLGLSLRRAAKAES